MKFYALCEASFRQGNYRPIFNIGSCMYGTRMQCQKWCCCLVFTSISCQTEPAYLCMLHNFGWCSLASGCLHCSWGCCKLRRGFGFHKLVISSATGVHHLEISYRKCLWTRPLRDYNVCISPGLHFYKLPQARATANFAKLQIICRINIIQALCVSRTLGEDSNIGQHTSAIENIYTIYTISACTVSQLWRYETGELKYRECIIFIFVVDHVLIWTSSNPRSHRWSLSFLRCHYWRSQSIEWWASFSKPSQIEILYHLLYIYNSKNPPVIPTLQVGKYIMLWVVYLVLVLTAPGN